MKFSLKSNGGFSLVELMIVVAIIGVLAALAVPRFQTFQAKAKQAEAKTNLSHIYTLEQAYRGDNDTYANLATVGFTTTGGKNRYAYTTPATTATTFTAQASTAAAVPANAVCPNAAVNTWTINENKVLAETAPCAW